MSTKAIPTLDAAELIERFEVLLLDAYGVLVHHGGALPGAAELIATLNARGKRYFILTNDASRSNQTSAARFAEMGLVIEAEQIISSGGLLARHFASHDLDGRPCVVLGPDDSRQLVRAAGGDLVTPGHDAEVLVVCDEVGYDFVETVDRVLSTLFARVDAGRPLALVLPNPDLVYPKGEGQSYGIAAGCIACIFEAALAQRYPDREDLRFVRLGKPNPPIFEEAVRRAGTRDLVMVGDQLGTDIKGANDFGVPSALVRTGLTRAEDLERPGAVRPTYLVDLLGTASSG
jgi:HAD superfamily hydrolase (TIGR01450 family)